MLTIKEKNNSNAKIMNTEVRVKQTIAANKNVHRVQIRSKPTVFLSHLLQNPDNSYEIWYVTNSPE